MSTGAQPADNVAPVTPDSWARRPVWLGALPSLTRASYAAAALAAGTEVVRMILGAPAPLTVFAFAATVVGGRLSWRRPVAGLGLILLGVLGVGVSGWDPLVESSIASFVAFAVGVRFDATWRLPVVVGLVLYLAGAAAEGGFGGTGAIATASAAVAIAMAGISLRVQARYLEFLAQRAARAIAERDTEAQRRVDLERLRIARDLHDVMGHSVAVASMRLGVAEIRVPAEATDARAALVSTRESLAAVLSETQQILGVLRRSGEAQDDAIRPAPDLGRVDELIGSFRELGLHVKVVRRSVPDRLEPVLSLTAYRIVQEGLTNALRYGEGRVDLDLHSADGWLSVTIENGCAARPSSGGSGMGLVGMRERIESLGGRLVVLERDRRFRVEADLPVEGGWA